MLFQVGLGAETVATALAVPAFRLFTLAQIELTTDEFLRLCVYRLDVHFHITSFGKLPTASRFWTLEPLAVGQRGMLNIHVCHQSSIGLASLAAGTAGWRVNDLDVGLKLRVGRKADLRALQ